MALRRDCPGRGWRLGDGNKWSVICRGNPGGTGGTSSNGVVCRCMLHFVHAMLNVTNEKCSILRKRFRQGRCRYIVAYKELHCVAMIAGSASGNVGTFFHIVQGTYSDGSGGNKNNSVSFGVPQKGLVYGSMIYGLRSSTKAGCMDQRSIVHAVSLRRGAWISKH